MKTQVFLSFRKILQIILFLALTLLAVSLTSHLSAAENDQGITNSTEQVAESVNINQADVEALARTLKGIGLKKAQAIVDWREQNGDFKSADQLTQVKGIGKKTLELNRSLISTAHQK